MEPGTNQNTTMAALDHKQKVELMVGVLNPYSNAKEFRVTGKQRAYWEKYGEYPCSLEVAVSPTGDWTELTLTENGSKSTRAAHMTLNRESLAALKAFLISIKTI